MPISDAQKMRCQTGVLLEPPEASVSTTMAPESADVTKDDNHRHGDKRKHAGEREMLRKLNNANATSCCTVVARSVAPCSIMR